LTLSIEDCGGRAGDGSDTTPAARLALARLKDTGDTQLVFPPGRYDFWATRGAERYLFIANNDEGLKHIALPITGFDELEILGDGAQFVFHGFVLPIVIDKSARVRLRGFSIDWARPFHSEAEVIETRANGVDLLIDDAFPYRLDFGRLVFAGEGGDVHGIGNILEWDPRKRETAPQVHDNHGIGRRYVAEAIGPQRVRLTAAFSRPKPNLGNKLVLVDEGRHCPAITITGSREITLTDITIHHAGAMGVIAQRSETIHLDRVRVTPPPDGKRLISTQNDATHFVNCKGHIELTDCLFENQMDDATNVHGIYAQISAKIRADALELRLMHRQQQGAELVARGDLVEFVRADTLLSYHEAAVRAVQRVNREFLRVTFDGSLPGELAVGDAVANLTWTPSLTIRGCTSRANRARGFLLSTPGTIVIEGNRFHVPGAAILIAGDASERFEAGAVRDVAIRDNLFEDCNFGVWGQATIQVTPEIAPACREASRYHRNIRIEGNRFVASDRRLLAAHCVDGLIFQNNAIEPSDAYPTPHGAASSVNLASCSNAQIDDTIASSSESPGDSAPEVAA